MVVLHLVRFICGVYAVVLVLRSQGGWKSWSYGYWGSWRSSSSASSSLARGLVMSTESFSEWHKMNPKEKTAYLGLLRNDRRSRVTAKPMSPGQRIVIKRMLSERAIPEDFVKGIREMMDQLTLERASRVIDLLKAYPRKQQSRGSVSRET